MHTRPLLKFICLWVASSILVFSSCKKDVIEDQELKSKTVNTYDFEIIHEWNNLFMDVEKYAKGYRPCPTANVLGYLGLANYEATVFGMADYQSIADRYDGLNVPKISVENEYHWPSVVNAVNKFLCERFFPDVDQSLFAKIKNLGDKYEKQYIAEVGEDVYIRSKTHGESVASAIWVWMKKDNVTFNGHIDPFKENNWRDRVNEPGAWTPTVPGPGEGMFPFWGNGRTLAIKDDQKICRPYTYYVGPFSEANNSGIYAQALEVMSQNTPSLSYQTEWVGEFWSDDFVGLTFSPPSRWIAIVNQVYNNEKATLEQAIVCNAKIGIALHDAAIACWNSKFHYNLERPESYIKRVIDPTWEPNLDNPNSGEQGISPSFPAYPSGHATFASSSAEVIASVFGYSYGMTDNCHKNRAEFSGYPRVFNSFYEMALECAWSRVPLGVHFRMDAEEGVRFGTEIGRTVNNLPWKK